MARYDLYKNPNPETRRAMPYLLDVQADTLDFLESRVVIPLLRIEVAEKPIKGLNPVFEVDGKQLMLATQNIAGTELANLGPVSGSLKEHTFEIVAAMDFLMAGV
jgi:toxin CcdB